MKPEGWLSPQEEAELEQLARGKVVLEIGSWLGLSTVTMARTAAHVVAVDHHRGSEEHQPGAGCFDPTLVNAYGEIDTLPRFRRNLHENRVREKVSIVVAKVDQIGPLFRSNSFGLVFIDGAHDTEAVRHDVKLAQRVVAPGSGVIAVHDYNWETVRRAADLEQLGQARRVTGSLAIFFR